MILFLVGSFARPPRQTWLLGKVQLGIPQSQYCGIPANRGKAWFRRRTFHVPILTEKVRLWSDTGATSDSDGSPCVEPRWSSTESDERLPHLTKTAVPSWFRRRSFAVFNSSVRFGKWVELRTYIHTYFIVTSPKGPGLTRLLYNGKNDCCCIYLRCWDLCKARQPGSCNRALSSIARFNAIPLDLTDFQTLRTYTQFQTQPLNIFIPPSLY